MNIKIVRRVQAFNYFFQINGFRLLGVYTTQKAENLQYEKTIFFKRSWTKEKNH
jgi:hypothetical protein